MGEKYQNIIMIVGFIVSFILLFVGQKNIGYTGLVMELVGLAGLILILRTYNKRYR